MAEIDMREPAKLDKVGAIPHSKLQVSHVSMRCCFDTFD